MSLSKRVGERIKVARLRADLSQEEMAAGVDVSIGTICHWEKGRRQIRLSRLDSVAHFLSIPVEWFVRDNDRGWSIGGVGYPMPQGTGNGSLLDLIRRDVLYTVCGLFDEDSLRFLDVKELYGDNIFRILSDELHCDY